LSYILWDEIPGYPTGRNRINKKVVNSNGVREGRRHSIYKKAGFKSEIPRHNEIVDELARKICKDLGIPFVR
jgi:mRNA interferase HicA